jgi:hypothetical protein
MKTPTVKVLLLNHRSHHFFAGAGEWASERSRAFNFERPEHAANLSKAIGIPEAEIILEYTDEPGEVAIALVPKSNTPEGQQPQQEPA